MDDNKTINFSTVPVGFLQNDNEEMIKKLAEKIKKETEEAGLPWWAGLFNSKIIEAAGIKRCECMCAETNTQQKENL